MSLNTDELAKLANKDFEELLERALIEDLSDRGDISSQAIFTTQTKHARIICKDELCLAGLEYAKAVFRRMDPGLELQSTVLEGQVLNRGQEVLSIHGSVKAILAAERIALNFMGYLSGIASRTRQMVELCKKQGASIILDTRKTLPAYRHLAKQAVALGGAQNHRIGLYDMIMIKDNHIDAAGGIKKALDAVKSMWQDKFKIEIECRTVDDVCQALDAGVDIIMLDNMEIDECIEALKERANRNLEKKVLFEASGDMNEERLLRYAGLGLDYISVGALTHSVKNANFSLLINL